MPITGKETATSGNIKATMKKLFSDTSLARKLRKNMGLGDTLGPLEPQYGGLGATVNPSVLNPSLGWKFPRKKTIKTNYRMSGTAIGGGTVGDKYYACFKGPNRNTPVIVTITDGGVTSEERLTELAFQATNQTANFIDDYSQDGKTFILGSHYTKCVLYSYNSSGVKSVVFNKTFSDNSFQPAIDKDGSVFVITGIPGNTINASYFKAGSPEKTISLSTDASITGGTDLSLIGNNAWIASKNTRSTSESTDIVSIDLVEQKAKTIAGFGQRETQLVKMPGKVYAFGHDSRSSFDPMVGVKLNISDVGPSTFAPSFYLGNYVTIFRASGTMPGGKDVGITPCGEVAIDNASMQFCLMPYNDNEGKGPFYGIGNEVFNVSEGYRTEYLYMNLNIMSIEKL